MWWVWWCKPIIVFSLDQAEQYISMNSMSMLVLTSICLLLLQAQVHLHALHPPRSSLLSPLQLTKVLRADHRLPSSQPALQHQLRRPPAGLEHELPGHPPGRGQHLQLLGEGPGGQASQVMGIGHTVLASRHRIAVYCFYISSPVLRTQLFFKYVVLCRSSYWYLNIYVLWLNTILNIIIPILSLIVLNISIMR